MALHPLAVLLVLSAAVTFDVVVVAEQYGGAAVRDAQAKPWVYIPTNSSTRVRRLRLLTPKAVCGASSPCATGTCTCPSNKSKCGEIGAWSRCQNSTCASTDVCGATDGCECPVTAPVCVGSGATTAKCKPECGNESFCAGTAATCGCSALKPKCGGTGTASRCQPNTCTKDDFCTASLGSYTAGCQCPDGRPNCPMKFGSPSVATGVFARCQPATCADTDFCTASRGVLTEGCECPTAKPKCPSKLLNQTTTTSLLAQFARCQPLVCTETDFCTTNYGKTTTGCSCPFEKPVCSGTGVAARCRVNLGTCLATAACKDPTACACPDTMPKCAILTRTNSICQHAICNATETCTVSGDTPTTGCSCPPDRPRCPTKLAGQATATGLSARCQPDVCTVTDYCTASRGGATSGCECPSSSPLCPSKFLSGLATGTSAKCQPLNCTANDYCTANHGARTTGCWCPFNLPKCVGTGTAARCQANTVKCGPTAQCRNPVTCSCPIDKPLCAIFNATASICQAETCGATDVCGVLGGCTCPTGKVCVGFGATAVCIVKSTCGVGEACKDSPTCGCGAAKPKCGVTGTTSLCQPTTCSGTDFCTANTTAASTSCVCPVNSVCIGAGPAARCKAYCDVHQPCNNPDNCVCPTTRPKCSGIGDGSRCQPAICSEVDFCSADAGVPASGCACPTTAPKCIGVGVAARCKPYCTATTPCYNNPQPCVCPSGAKRCGVSGTTSICQPNTCTDSNWCTTNYGTTTSGCSCPASKPLCVGLGIQARCKGAPGSPAVTTTVTNLAVRVAWTTAEPNGLTITKYQVRLLDSEGNTVTGTVAGMTFPLDHFSKAYDVVHPGTYTAWVVAYNGIWGNPGTASFTVEQVRNDARCLIDSDCLSHFCTPDTQLCKDPTCSDKFRNGDETGVDCGGTCANALGKTCEDGQGCLLHSECSSSWCNQHTFKCQATSIVLDGLGGLVAGFAVADFSGDGKADLVALLYSGTYTVQALLGDGFGGFKTPIPQALSIGNAYDMLQADWNMDGHLDIAVSNPSNPGTIEFFVWDGSASALTHGGSLAVDSAPTMMAAADFNSDGRMDLAVVVYGGVRFWLQTGAYPLTFTPPTQLNLCSPNAILAVEFSGDSKMDLVIACEGHVILLRGNGDGSFTLTSFFFVCSSLFDIAVGYFNDDAFPDFVVTCPQDGTIAVSMGKQGGPDGVSSTLGIGSAPFRVAVADLDADSYQDIVVTNSLDASISILQGHGDGTFSLAVVAPTFVNPYKLVIADVDGDSQVDMLVPISGYDSIMILFGRESLFT